MANENWDITLKAKRYLWAFVLKRSARHQGQLSRINPILDTLISSLYLVFSMILIGIGFAGAWVFIGSIVWAIRTSMMSDYQMVRSEYGYEVPLLVVLIPMVLVVIFTWRYNTLDFLTFGEPWKIRRHPMRESQAMGYDEDYAALSLSGEIDYGKMPRSVNVSATQNFLVKGVRICVVLLVLYATSGIVPGKHPWMKPRPDFDHYSSPVYEEEYEQSDFGPRAKGAGRRPAY